jgi:hypothetical protein
MKVSRQVLERRVKPRRHNSPYSQSTAMRFTAVFAAAERLPPLVRTVCASSHVAASCSHSQAMRSQASLSAADRLRSARSRA